ncbi:MAG: hypothetical protein GY803_19475 [Chloroflexi bacterium]|nr:hypothetical protein [Chloroflexota bacterium]
MNNSNIINFKFKFVKNKHARGFSSKKAVATEHNLMLNDMPLPYDFIVNSTSRDSRLVLVLAENVQLDEMLLKEVNPGRALVLEVYKVQAREVEKYIDRLASASQAERQRQALIAAGKEHLFRKESCPHCHAAINLTEFEKTAHIHCHFCDSILSKNQEIVSNGDLYDVCDECGMFDRVQGYTYFIFYFLVLFYGFRSERKHLCDSCAIRLSNRAFWINLVFILGVPPALYMRYKAMQGREQAFKNLAKANKLGCDGNYQEADALYEQILMQHPGHPGILYNQSLAHFNGKNGDGGVRYLRESLKGSSNYLPALRLVHRLQQTAKN